MMRILNQMPLKDFPLSEADQKEACENAPSYRFPLVVASLFCGALKGLQNGHYPTGRRQ
jgi:hypothetical protein